MKEEDFLARVQELGALPTRKEARRWATAVFRAMAHLLPDAEARRHFVTQLPGGLKSAQLAEPPHPLLMDREAFVQHVAAALGTHAPEGERALRTVYTILREAVSPGQIAQFEAHLPKDIATLLESERRFA
ncbi:MAG: DUF2267 domain-containing protein [Deltaproteobacteria bacterium]|nr:DUF2267 domain-containing protein [Deltaproteobacteria bacterium]MBI3077927.1 DUF2267 domain-containing protein [Deltaproteobacteria bacterium]